MATSIQKASKPKSGLQTIAELVQAVPVVGPVLAWLITNLGVGIALLTVVFFLIFPLAYPLIMSALVNIMPEKARIAYTSFVLESFQGSIEKNIDDTVDRIIKDNNTRLDFVQQFSLAWPPGVTRSPAYSFPLMIGQEFDLEFTSGSVPNPIPCRGEKAARADEAARNKRLFTIWALGKDRLSSSLGDRQKVPFGEKFWQAATTEVDLLNGGGTAAARIEIDQSLAKEIAQCFQIVSTLDIVVRKTIKAAKRPNLVANSTLDAKP